MREGNLWGTLTQRRLLQEGQPGAGDETASLGASFSNGVADVLFSARGL